MFTIFVSKKLGYYYCIFCLASHIFFISIFYISFFIFKLYFNDYAITAVPIFPLLSPLPSMPHSLSQSPHLCSCPWAMCINSLAISYSVFISPWLFCNYLLVLLNPLTSSPIPPNPPPIW